MCFLVDRHRVYQKLRHVVMCEIFQSSCKAEVLEAMLLCRSRVVGLTCHPISCFHVCTLASGCWRQVQHIGFSLGGHCFPLLFPAWEFAGVGAILLHIGGYPSSCVRLCPMGVFQWHRGELCTLSCGRRDGPDGGTHPPGSKYLGTTQAGTVNAK